MGEPNRIDLRSHDLNLFVVFVALMEERSVTRAALKLHMSQAAVSAALSRLRRAHDDHLFTRVPGGMAPTARAQSMYIPVLEALHAVEVAIGGEHEFDPRVDRFDLRVGMSDDIEAVLMPQILERVSPTSPGLSVLTLQSTRLRLAAMLESGEADLGVVASTVWGSQLRYRVLFASDYVCVYDPRRIGHDGAIDFEEYLATPQIMISVDGTRGVVDDILDLRGRTRHRIASTAHFAMVPLLLTSSRSIATMPRHAALALQACYRLVVCEAPIDLPSFEVAVVWHQARDTDPRVSWMVEQIQGLATHIAPSRPVGPGAVGSDISRKPRARREKGDQ